MNDDNSIEKHPSKMAFCKYFLREDYVKKGTLSTHGGVGWRRKVAKLCVINGNGR